MNRKQFLSLAGVSTLGLTFPAPIFSSESREKQNFLGPVVHEQIFSRKKMPMTLPFMQLIWDLQESSLSINFILTNSKMEPLIKNVSNLAKTLNSRAKDNNITNVLIMVDLEGNIADTSSKEIKTAIEQHKKWVELAAETGCHSIRVNLSGEKDPKRWIDKSVEGLTGLCGFAKTMGINIIVENHGGLSSNGSLLAQVMKKTN